jgi:phosphatidate cytidylyltransferase
LLTLALVWATDIFAYFAGRGIGGAKLAPSISPNKTWAGLAGGMLGAGITGLAVSYYFQLSILWAAASVFLAIASQGGDLFESWLKRRTGVKDSGALLPGHGGVLDRLDGVVPVAVIVALACAGFGLSA